jgi:hypothetical protein
MKYYVSHRSHRYLYFSSGVVEGVVDCCRGRCLPTGDYAERVVEEVVDSNRGRYIGNGEYTMTAGRTRARTASASGYNCLDKFH